MCLIQFFSNMKTKYFIFLAVWISSVFNFYVAEAQYNDRCEVIKDKFSPAQLKDMKRADNFITSGDVFMQEVKAIELEVFSLQESLPTLSKKEKKEAEKKAKELKQEALVKLIDATKTGEKGYDIRFNVMRQKLEELSKASNESDKNKQAKKAIYDGNLKIVEARDIINKLTDRDDYDYISNQVKNAKLLKLESINILLDVICLYIDCNPKEIVVHSNENNVAENTNNNNLNNQNSNDKQTNNSGNVKTKKAYIYFTVQIIAVKNPLPNIKVDDLYKGSKNITASYHDNLWKYMVGRFDNYDDARIFQEGIGRDSFVVAIKDGERINIVDAINETKE